MQLGETWCPGDALKFWGKLIMHRSWGKIIQEASPGSGGCPPRAPPVHNKRRRLRGEEGIVPVDTSGALIMSRCINWPPQHGQKTRNNFLTDHFLVLLGISPPRALLLHPEHLGQRHRRCPPRPRNCDHNAHYSDRRSQDRIAGGVGTHFALMDRVLCFPGRLVQVERLWGEKWENPPSCWNRRSGVRIPTALTSAFLQNGAFSALLGPQLPQDSTKKESDR